MIYSINNGIGWISSGIEFAQLYRAKVLRNLSKDYKFIYTEFTIDKPMEDFTSKMGFNNDEVIWLYSFFTDFKYAPTTYTFEELEKTFPQDEYEYSRDGNVGFIKFNDSCFYKVYFTNDTDNYVFSVEIASGISVVRRDFYSYAKMFSEYFGPLDGHAHIYLRRFFNTDGSLAYEEIYDETNSDEVMFRFKDRIINSRNELLGYMLSKLNLTKDDYILADRLYECGQAILNNCGDAKVVAMIHAEHFSVENTDDEYILWNNYYQYAFMMHKHIAFYVVSTSAQADLLSKQFKKYMNIEPIIKVVPVGSIDEVKYPTNGRKPYSLVTASRLAIEKHIPWMIKATAIARKTIPQLTLDIYGSGDQYEECVKAIKDNNAEEFVKLCGYQKMDDIYKDYEAYLSASLGEGFGLSLLEAIGSGLPIIGYDVRYGNQTFVDNEKNGYLFEVKDTMSVDEKTDILVEGIIKMFTQTDLDKFHEHSYTKANEFLTKNVEKIMDEAFK